MLHENTHPINGAVKPMLILFTAAIIAIVCTFFYDFLQTYKAELNQALFYSLIFIGFCAVILSGSGVVYVMAMLALHYETKRLYANQQRQNIQTISANNALFTATTEQISAGRVYLAEQRTEQGIIKFKALPRHATKQKTGMDTARALPLLDFVTESKPEPKTTLLADIRDYQRILLVGGQNSGKTTLLKHIAKQRSAAGSVWVLDSHNHAGKWDKSYKIVGHGRDYFAIENELKNLVDLMDSRYKEYASGKVKEREHELITVISDEFTTIAENLNNLDCYLLPLLTESRKVAIDFIVACHSETASSLGLKGRFDLKKNFDAVLRLKNFSGKRLVHLDNGELIKEYAHCGQFQDDFISRDFSNKLDDILNNPIAELSIEKKIITVYWQLKNENKPISLSAICMAVYGYKKGEKIKLIARILAENSLVTTE